MNRFTKTCLLIPLLWFSNHTLLHAQKEANIWYFGRNAGISFNTEPPTVLSDSKMLTMEGCSSISDENGNLLFYTDGQSVWNRLHQKMSNGSGLNGNASSTHSSVIVKKPYNDSIYYIITADEWPNINNQNKGVSYSVVDLRLNGGLGNIVEKNTQLVSKSAEKIAATIHRNGTDIWIAIPEAGTGNIVMFLVTENGIQLHHNIVNFYVSGYSNWGQMKFSPNSKLLALSYPDGTSSTKTIVAIAHFDNLTGTISNPHFLRDGQNVYGVEFSPSSTLVYFSSWLGAAGTSGIYQYNVKDTTSLFYNACAKIWNVGKGQLQLAPNGKIYSPNDSFLSVIDAPDSAGLGCGFVADAIHLRPMKSWFGLPTFYGKYVNKNRIGVDSTCLGDHSFIYATKDTLLFDSAHWFIDDVKLQQPYYSFYHQFPASGYFTVKLVLFKHFFTDTFEREVFIKPINIIHPNLTDIHLCSGESTLLNAYKEAGISYKWSTGSSDSIIQVNTSGTYTVQLTKQGCPLWDTAVVYIAPPFQVNLPPDVLFCRNNSITISVSEPYGSCLWSTGDTTHTITVATPGKYSVTLSRDQCASVDSMMVYQTDTPTVSLGSDTLVCENAPFILDATFPHSSYQWSTQSAEPTLNANREDTYWVKVSNICGSATDTLTVYTVMCDCSIYVPNAFTPNDDRLNDEFKPILNCSTLAYSFQLFDRWGQLLFSSNDPAIGWDGTLKQIGCGPDTYFWVVSYAMAPPVGNGQMESKKGSVTLLR